MRASCLSALRGSPVFLVTMAYQLSLNNPRVGEERRVSAALELSSAGLGMIAGQTEDIRQDHARAKAGSRLLDCYQLKSGALCSRRQSGCNPLRRR